MDIGDVLRRSLVVVARRFVQQYKAKMEAPRADRCFSFFMGGTLVVPWRLWLQNCRIDLRASSVVVDTGSSVPIWSHF